MYSVVLMAALTTATDMPDWGRRGGCCGCWGGWGGWGGCYGGWGGWGGCYGGYGWGGWGGWGYGGWGGWGGYGGWGYAYAPVVSPYASPVMVASNMVPAATPGTRSMYYNPDTSASNRATIIVHVPDNATLTVDGKATTSTSSTRRFYSPPLEPGKSYHYNFEAKMERDGQTVKAEKRVDVHAGDTREITITLPELNPSAERKPPARGPAERRGLLERRVGVASR
jgi:uncharacterized protein (TIGR03000 family)